MKEKKKRRVRRLHIMAMEDPLKQCHIANEEQRRKRPMSDLCDFL